MSFWVPLLSGQNLPDNGIERFVPSDRDVSNDRLAAFRRYCGDSLSVRLQHFCKSVLFCTVNSELLHDRQS